MIRCRHKLTTQQLAGQDAPPGLQKVTTSPLPPEIPELTPTSNSLRPTGGRTWDFRLTSANRTPSTSPPPANQVPPAALVAHLDELSALFTRSPTLFRRKLAWRHRRHRRQRGTGESSKSGAGWTLSASVSDAKFRRAAPFLRAFHHSCSTHMHPAESQQMAITPRFLFFFFMHTGEFRHVLWVTGRLLIIRSLLYYVRISYYCFYSLQGGNFTKCS